MHSGFNVSDLYYSVITMPTRHFKASIVTAIKVYMNLNFTVIVYYSGDNDT